MLMHKSRIIVLLATLGIHCSASAQAMLSVRCTFSNGNSASYVGGDVKQSRAQNETLSIVYDQISSRDRTARMIGNSGATDVGAMFTEGGRLHLIELTAVGNLNVMTLFNYQQLTPGAHVPSVYSRHVAFSRGETVQPLPSQYYGSCVSLL